MINIWFYKFHDDIAKKHRAAYEKSLTSAHAIKVRAGSYYYKGYEVDYNEERCKDYQWRYRKVDEYPEDSEFVKTKAECLANIEGLIEYNK